jgi:hypothetical protein
VNHVIMPGSLPTRFADLSPRQAWQVVGLTLLTLGACLAQAFDLYPGWLHGLAPAGPPPVRPAGRTGEALDLQLFRAVVDRVHAGESYYSATQEEMRQRGYPTRSVFNWRLPTYAWLLSALPDPAWGQFILAACSLAVLMLAFFLVQRDHGLVMATITLMLLSGSLYWCLVENVFYSQEVWAGTLILLSLCCYGVELRPLAVASGLAALFYRELALPYCVIAAGIAVWQRRKLEAGIWLAGIALFALFLLWHAEQVTSRLTAEDELIVGENWVVFGGLRFVLLTARMNRFLFTAPPWLHALYVPLALLGLAGWRGMLGLRMFLTALGYVLAFCVVGNPRINDYWGLLYVGLLPFGIVWAPLALRDLARAALGRPAKSHESLVPS